ncbi:IclR family transcriptional regulator [Lentzea sp. NPDC051213]|uniref:IclR family transcriptional regulator n=1 Tax=Lentzea sp. NPDC051213 TaxID=3364126 RepID=UPI0037AE2071
MINVDMEEKRFITRAVAAVVLPAGGDAHCDGTDNDIDPGPLGAVQKALLLLQAFTPGAPPVGISELARRVQLAKSTTHRLLKIMLTYGFVRKEDDKYQLGHRFTGLADEERDRQLAALKDRAMPFLADLYALTHGTIHLAVPSGEEALCIDMLRGQWSPRCQFRPGTRVPAESGAIGRVLLAYSSSMNQPLPIDGPLVRDLRRIRREGICIGLANGSGLATVAAPMLRHDLSAVAAVSITGPAARITSREVLAGIREICHQARQAVSSVFPAERAACW